MAPDLPGLVAERAASCVETRVLDAAADIAARGGDSVRGVIFFGSRRSGARTNVHSGWDVFVVVEAYGPFYAALRQSGSIRRSPAVFAALNAFMPPNQVAIETSGGDLAKCAVISMSALERETGRGRRDHFCAGRLFQPVAIVFAADDAARQRLLSSLVSAVRLTGEEWGRSALPERFDADGFGRCVLALSMSWEIRPEPRSRAQALWTAQKDEMLPVIEALFREMSQRGDLIARGPGEWSLSRPAAPFERGRLAAFGLWSMLRATLRWFKYVWTFEGWLDYLLRKIERHTGEHMELTDRERRWPLIFLWPRMYRFWRGRDRAAQRRREES